MTSTPPYGQADAGGQSGGEARERARATAEQAKSSAAQVADTAREQVREVASDAGRQTKAFASDVRDRLAREADEQSTRAADLLAKWADDLSEMAGDGDSPARAMARQLSERGREFADQLREGGPNDVLDQVRAFARRRPAAFLAGSAAAGFLVGRLGKGIAKADSGSSEVERYGDVPEQRYGEMTDPRYQRTAEQPYAGMGEYGRTAEQPYGTVQPEPYPEPGYPQPPMPPGGMGRGPVGP
ncbi:hypothetical protein ACFQV2_06310 [Actinokineospora soli]|uniref:Uncharacterized protein n=1 Tax=Actinokineospora soli TaxID=1048753 RepID=A0ABW2TKF2_9PSEU